MKAKHLRGPRTEHERLAERECVHRLNEASYGEAYFVLRWALDILEGCSEAYPGTVKAFRRVLSEVTTKI